MKSAIKKSFKRITITRGIYKYKKSDQIRSLKSHKKEARKEFESAKPSEKQEKLEIYIEGPQKN